MQPGAPAPAPELVRALADTLTEVAPPGWQHLSAEWSQAGAQHSGRAHVTDPSGTRAITLPDAAVAAFAALRAQGEAPGVGAWLSARIELTPDGEPTFSANYDQRPNWAAPGTTMLTPPDPAADPFAPAAAPVPSDDRWLADLHRHPRDRAHIPPWLAADAVQGEAVAELRAALDSAGVPRAAVVLPGEPPGPVFEGTLQVVQYSATHYGLRVSDYGQHHLMGEFRSERQACLALWQYLTAPMPAPVPLTQADLAARAAGAQRSFADLYDRLRNVGQGGILTNLAPGIPYDRIGGVDGLYFFGWGTPWEQRSLPPGAREGGACAVSFVALRPVEIQAEIVPPWFGQPGGGIRFHVEGGRAVRDLVREQVLALIEIAG